MDIIMGTMDIEIERKEMRRRRSNDDSWRSLKLDTRHPGFFLVSTVITRNFISHGIAIGR